ncbi:hypothetical protein CMK11_18270 [Candidatus Poribacteria bacterium]|nr:hypothetical protein [Candidatus Poribacteria bacterium]
MSDSRGLSRRRFIALASGLTLPAAWAGCRSRPASGDGAAVSIKLADHPALGAEGGFVTLDSRGAAPAMLLVRDGEAVRAFANLCTHAACPLLPDAADGVIHCDRDCGHGSVYSMAGEVIHGPSTRSLYEFESALDETGVELTIQMVLKPA